MIWKTIGKSVAGTAHMHSGRECEDANSYIALPFFEDEILIIFLSDGAGSASYGGFASKFVTNNFIEACKDLVFTASVIKETDIIKIAEKIYWELEEEAETNNVPLNEYSCTLLGCIISPFQTIFIQIGDGAIIRYEEGKYIPIWFPQNGEYLNTTHFFIDDHKFANLNILILDEVIKEVALFTDGLQTLALNYESKTVHQPFFNELFKVLRQAIDIDKINILNYRLEEYLNNERINTKTDDDKSLILATIL